MASGGLSNLNPLVNREPPARSGLDALQSSLTDMVAMGEQAREQVRIKAPPTPVQAPSPTIAFSPSTKQFFVQGKTFAEDDAQSALESEALLGQPGTALPQGGDWVSLDQQSYAGYLQGVKNPSLGTLFSKGIGRGVDSMQLLAGRGLQLAGAEKTGAGIVNQQVEDLRKTAPFTRQFTDVKSGGDALEWFVANLGEQIPNLLESAAVAGAGAIAGTATGGPGVGTAGGVLAGLMGKSAFKTAVIAAAKKKAAGEILDLAERKVLRSAGALMGAAATTYTNSLAMGASDIYGELRDQGADPEDISAKMTAIAGAFPYALAESASEFLLAGRVFGGIAAPRAMAAGTSLRRKGAELLRRGAVGGTLGAAAEGGTEVAQEALLLGLSDQDFSKPENIERLINSFAAGAAIGGPIGAVANLKGKKPANLLTPGTPGDMSQLGGPGQVPLLGGPAQGRELMVPGTDVVPSNDPRYYYTAGLALDQQQQLQLPPPGAVLQVEGQPDFVVDENGNVRPATAEDTVVGISGGYVPANAPGSQGVLNIFPEGQTTARELRGMMEPTPAQATMLLQPEGVTGEAPAGTRDTSQDVLPLETGLAPRFFEPAAPTGTLAGNPALLQAQAALLARQATNQQFADVPPVVTPDVTALDQRLAESQPFLDVMGTEGRFIPEPQYGTTPEEAQQAWTDTKAGRTRNWGQLSQEAKDQWTDALNGNYAPNDLKQVKRDLSIAQSAAKLTGAPLRTVVTGAISPNPVKKEPPRAAKKPKATALARGKQAGAGKPAGAKLIPRPAAPRASILKAQKPRQETVVDVQDVKADPQYKPTLAAIDAAVKRGDITGTERLKLLNELRKDGDFELVTDTLKQKRAAAKKPAPKVAAKAAPLKRGKPTPTYASVRKDIIESADADIISQDQYDTLIKAVDNQSSDPDRIKAQLTYLEKGGTVKRVPAGEAAGLRAKEREVVREEAPAEVAGNLTGTDTDYRDLNQSVNEARDLKEIQPLQARVLQDMIAKRKPLAEIRRALAGLVADNKLTTKKQEIRRRDFLAGLAATVVVATTVDTKAFAQTGTVKKMDLKAIIDGLSPKEAVSAVLQWISQNATSSLERRIAAKLLKNGMGNTELFTQNSINPLLYGTSSVNPDGTSTVTIFGPQGLNIETVLHELIHAYVQQRWAGLGVYTSNNKRLLGDTKDRNDKLIADFQELWAGLNLGITDNFPSLAENADWIAAIGDPDELLSWVLTNPDVQAFMRTISPNGKPITNPKNSLWESFKKWIMELLGMKYVPSELTALDRVLALGEEIIDAGAAVRTGEFSADFAKYLDERSNSMLVNEQRVNKLIDGLPSSLQDPVRTVTDTFGGFGTRAVANVGLMDQLVRLAISKGMKAARRFDSVMRSRDRIVSEQQTPFLKWAEDHSRLPANERGTGEGTVSNLMMKMTMAEEWGFRPDYFDAADKDAAATVKMNPEFEAAYKRLSPAGQKSVRDIFKLNYGMLKDMQKTVVDMTITEYDALIEGTKDADAKAKLEADKANSLLQFRTLLAMDPTRPYASLRRNGNWVVVGRSDRLRKAEAEDVKDFKLIRQLEEDEAHHAVVFADTRAEAARIERELEALYGQGNTEKFLKSDPNEQLYGGHDMTYAFQRINTLLEEQGGDPKVVQQLRNAATQLQLMVMATSSARKAELRRRNIYGGNIDMVQTSLSHARATAHFLGAVSKNSEILESLQKMNAEARVMDGGREDRQAIYNSIVARYVDGLQSRSDDTIADKLTSFTSVWMLGFAPSYYIQQTLQNLTLTMPEVAARYGYRDTFKSFQAGYGQVMKAWEDSSLTEQLDIGKVDPKYQAFAMFLSESGALDVGIEREMGQRTADSSGVASNAFARATDFVRGLTRKIEAINRLSAGIAVYDLARSGSRGKPIELDPKEYSAYVKDFNKAHPDMSPMSKAQYTAALEALDTINITHGDYSMANAPKWLRGSLGRVLGQFQKFRIMLAGVYVRNFYNAFQNKDLSPEEKRIARRALMYVSGHAAILGGLIGSPAAATFILIYNMLSGNDEERGDLERDIRNAVGNETIANLLLRGTPTLFGVDVSGTLGQGNLLSVSPYAELPSDRQTFAAYVLSLTGPAIGGIGGNVADAIALTSDGNYYKALEKLVPRGIGAASRTIRETATGETTMRGDTLTQPIDLGAVEAIWGTLGLAPIARVNRQFARNTFYKDQRFYQERAADIKRVYVDASQDKDTARMNMLRLEWKALQDARRERGYKTQTMLDLIKAPREKAKREAQTVGGVPFTEGTKGRAEQIAKLAGTTR